MECQPRERLHRRVFALPEQPGKIYMKLIDNTHENRFALDIRVPMFDGQIPLAFLKRCPLDQRFIGPCSLEVTDVETVLSQGELDLIRRVARGLGLDYAEMDLVRDRQDGKLYVIDANWTPHPDYHIDEHSESLEIELLTQSFASLLRQ